MTWSVTAWVVLLVLFTEPQRPLLSNGKMRLVTSRAGEGNDTPLQYSCLENPMDGGAW